MPHPELLDPQGKATHAALQQLGFEAISKTRIGKRIYLEIDAPDADQALELARKAAQQLLVNPVVETFDLELLED